MKAKTIKAVLRKKFDEFVASIDDPAVAKLVDENSIITGGSIVSMLLGEKVNDYDIYFTNRDTALAVAKYYVAKFLPNPPTTFVGSKEEVPIFVEETDGRIKIVIKSAGIASEAGTGEYQYFETQPDDVGQNYVDSVMAPLEAADEVSGATIDSEKPTYRPVFISANAITLSGAIQLIIRFFGPAEEIHANYDFVHCTCCWQSFNGHLNLPAAALEAIITKELRYVGSKYPLCSIIRIRKFVARGWQINAGQILKMCMQLNALDLLNLSVLEDQLTGVDAFYFMQVIDRLRAKQEESGEKSIDTTYLMTIIDRMF